MNIRMFFKSHTKLILKYMERLQSNVLSVQVWGSGKFSTLRKGIPGSERLEPPIDSPTLSLLVREKGGGVRKGSSGYSYFTVFYFSHINIH